MTPPIEKILVLSTAHLTQEVAEALPIFITSDADLAFTPWWPSWSRNEGWMFYVPPRSIEDNRYETAPSCVQACVNFAREVECRWVMFDRDGTVVDGLPMWAW